MLEQTELKPIETKIQSSKMFWIYFRSQIILFTAAAVLGFVMFVVTLNDAIVERSVYKFVLAFVFMVCTILTSSFNVSVFEIIIKAKIKQGIIVTALYSDFMIMQTRERGSYGEERYCCKDFTVAKEKKKYFKLFAPHNAGNIIVKDGLSPEQLNAVRRTFGLPLDGTGEVVLPTYAENGNAAPTISEVISCENSRVIKSSFGEYASRDRQIMRSRFVISILLGVCSFVGTLSTFLYYKNDIIPTWARVIIWATSIIFIIDTVYYLFLRNILNRAIRSVKNGALSEYLIFADCIIVYVHIKDGFTVVKIPYDKIAHVRETKDDVWIKCKLTGDLTFPIIKNTLSSAQYTTLMNLLTRATSAETEIELDNAPPLNGRYKDIV